MHQYPAPVFPIPDRIRENNSMPIKKGRALNKPETVTEAKRNTLIRAAVGLLQHERTSAVAIEMLGAEPHSFIAIGTAAEIAQLLREDDEPATAASHPARRMRRGDRPTEPLSWEDESAPAATSGDAPTDTDILQDVRDLFESCGFEVRPGAEFCELVGSIDAGGILVDALLARIERAAVSAATKPTTDLPTNDEVYAEVVRQRGTLNHYVSTNAVNDTMAAVRSLLATKPTADCEHCGARLPLHLLTCPVAVKGMAEGKKKEAPEPLRQLLIDLSNNTYFCGLHLDDDAKYAGYMREAETAEQAIIDYFQSLLATKPAAVPEGAGIDANGTTYHNIAEIYHQAEECAALHMWLDDQGVPRTDAEGRVFSPVGRVIDMAQDAGRFRWLNADHDAADVREQARSLAGRLGTSSYFAITRDIDEAMRRSAPDGAQGEGA